MFVRRLLLLLTFLPSIAIGSVTSPIPEWSLFLKRVDKEILQEAGDFLARYVDGKVDASEISGAKPIVRAAVVGVALTEFLRNDFLEKHPGYVPGKIYTLVLKCAEKGFDKETEKLLWKAQGSSSREFGTELFLESDAISSFDFKKSQLKYLLAVLFLPLFFSYQTPGAYAFIAAASATALVPLLIPQNTAGFFPTRNGKEPQLQALLTEEERSFERGISEAARIARVNRDKIAAVYDVDIGPRIPTFFVPASLFSARPRRIVVSSARGRLFKILSKKEVATVLRHEHRHLNQKLFPWLLFGASIFWFLLSSARSDTDNGIARQVLSWVAEIIVELLLAALLLAVTRRNEGDADSSAAEFAVQEWGEEEGKRIFATALEKLLLFTRARQPPFILKEYLENTLKARDSEHGDPLHRISVILSWEKPSAKR